MPALIASSPTARSRLHVSAAGREVIASDKAPTPLGPYSQAIKVDSTLYISGQIGLDPATGKMAGDDVEAQATQVMKNMGAVLEAAGANWGSIAKTTILLADMGDFAKVNAIYGEYFKTDPPARACYAAKTLPADALVEIEAIAHV